MEEGQGREPWAHPRVKWWAWFIPTVIFLVALLWAAKSFRTPMEQGASSAGPPVAEVQELLA